MTRPLTPKQQAFVLEYLIDLNATQAAIRAGYSLADNDAREKFYVYFLVDPRTGLIFYVGKGTGRRVSHHARNAKSERSNGAKAHRILEIQAAGLSVDERIFSWHRTEEDAYAVERELIDGLSDHGLTNMAGGIVSREESDRQKSRSMLTRLKPFDVWVSSVPSEVIETTRRVFGDPAAFYERFREELRRCAECPN